MRERGTLGVRPGVSARRTAFLRCRCPAACRLTTRVQPKQRITIRPSPSLFLVLTSDTPRAIVLVSTVYTMNHSTRPPAGHPRPVDPPDAGREPRHGWAISERIQQLSKDVLQVNQGSLYPALHRLEDQGWIMSEWGVSELGRRAQLLSDHRRGPETARAEREWAQFSAAVGRHAPGLTVLSLRRVAADG